MSKGVFRRPRLLSTIVSTAVLAVMIQPSHAGKVNISGFATFGTGFNDLRNQPVSTTNPASIRPTLEGMDKKLNFNELSRLGMQFNTRVNKRLSATMQLVGQGISQFDGRIAWAYGTFNINKNFLVQAGRLRSPIFMKSQSLAVGYSYDWVAPPREVYSLVSIDDFNGVSASYKKFTKNFNITATAYTAGTTVDLLVGGQSATFDMRNAIGAELKGSIMRKLRYRAGYVSAEFSTPLVTTATNNTNQVLLNGTGAAGQGVYNALYASGVISAADLNGNAKFINDINIRDSKGTFLGFGLDYSIAKLNISGEYVYRTFDDAAIITETAAWYLGASYKIKKFVPYLYYATQKSQDDDERTGYTGTGAAIIQATMQSLFDTHSDAWALGLRYNILPKTALKIEWKQSKAKDGTKGMMSAVPTGDNDDTTNLYRATLDILF